MGNRYHPVKIQRILQASLTTVPSNTLMVECALNFLFFHFTEQDAAIRGMNCFLWADLIHIPPREPTLPHCKGASSDDNFYFRNRTGSLRLRGKWAPELAPQKQGQSLPCAGLARGTCVRGLGNWRRQRPRPWGQVPSWHRAGASWPWTTRQVSFMNTFSVTSLQSLSLSPACLTGVLFVCFSM